MHGKHVRTRKGLNLAYFKKPPKHYPGEPEEEQVCSSLDQTGEFISLLSSNNE